MTLLAEIAAVSRRVGETRSRLAKVREIAECLRRISPEEIAVTIAALSGEIRQGKLDVAYAALHSANAVPPSAG